MLLAVVIQFLETIFHLLVNSWTLLLRIPFFIFVAMSFGKYYGVALLLMVLNSRPVVLGEEEGPSIGCCLASSSCWCFPVCPFQYDSEFAICQSVTGEETKISSFLLHCKSVPRRESTTPQEKSNTLMMLFLEFFYPHVQSQGDQTILLSPLLFLAS